jgi:hypothetical protein
MPWKPRRCECRVCATPPAAGLAAADLPQEQQTLPARAYLLLTTQGALSGNGPRRMPPDARQRFLRMRAAFPSFRYRPIPARSHSMPHKQQPVSVADIHSIYGGKQRAPQPQGSATYRKASFSVREEGHPGTPPPRQPPNTKTRSR